LSTPSQIFSLESIAISAFVIRIQDSP
jgi:hypothetical protein